MFHTAQITCRTVVLLCLFCTAAAHADQKVDLRLVSARDHIEGSFTTAKVLYADRQRIYLASFQGDLFVLARDRAADFPVLQVVRDSTLPLTGVTGDGKNLYVTDFGGLLRKYRKTRPLGSVDTQRVASFGLGGVEVIGNRLYVALGTRAFDVNRKHVFLGELNEFDAVIELDKKTLRPLLTYGEGFIPQMTVIFDRRTAQPLMALPNPLTVSGQVAHPNLMADKTYLFRAVPGCCGASLEVFDARTFELIEHRNLRAANVVTRRGRWLVVGDEFGKVHLFDLKESPARLIETIDLRQATGHFGPAAIEIRALWSDHHDNLVFAASSWGSESIRGPELPSFFVLELARK